MSKTVKDALSDFINLWTKQQSLYSRICTIVSVDSTARTCVVKPIDSDAEITGVRLQGTLNLSDGVVFIPTVDSKVIVTFIIRTRAYVSSFAELDELKINCDVITFNDGTNDGLI